MIATLSVEALTGIQALGIKHAPVSRMVPEQSRARRCDTTSGSDRDSAMDNANPLTRKPMTSGLSGQQGCIMNYQLEPVWPSPSQAIRDEVVAFWQAEHAIPDLSVARERAHQLLVVAHCDAA